MAAVWTRQRLQSGHQTCWHKNAPPPWNLEGSVFKSQTQKCFNLKRDAALHITHVHDLKPVLWLDGFTDVITISFPMHNWNCFTATQALILCGFIYQIHCSKKCFNGWLRNSGDRGSTVVKVLCYNWEGRWFDPSWCQWNFYWHKILLIALWPWGRLSL